MASPGRFGLLGRLASVIPSYLWIAWWGVASPRLTEREPLVVYQAVVRRGDSVLLSVRFDLRGWELPGGHADPGESGAEAIVREVREETGLDVSVVRHVGDYIRTGFRPHTARVYECRVDSGDLRPSIETPMVRWFHIDGLPDTLFPWYRAPLADACKATGHPHERHEHQGFSSIWAGLVIDLRMRLADDRAGLPPENEEKRPSA